MKRLTGTRLAPQESSSADSPEVAGTAGSNDGDAAAPPSRPRRRRVLVGGVVVLLCAGGTGLAITIGADDASIAATNAVPTAAATVELRDLVVTEDMDGELGYGQTFQITTNAGGVITHAPQPGEIITPGQSIIAIDAEPMILAQGEMPFYRTLDVDATDGPDIAQLEGLLAALGYGSDLTVDQNFTYATAVAVENWETDLGRADPDGVVAADEVYFHAGQLRVAQVATALGAVVEPGSPVLEVSLTDKVVNVDLGADDASSVHAGDKVSVTLPDGTKTPGTIFSVGTEAESDPTDPKAVATLPVQVSFDEPDAATSFAAGSVDVSLEQFREDDAVAAPVTALIALAEGGYAVEIVAPTEATGYRLVGVEIGTVADGYVALIGDVAVGDEVVVPE